MAELGVEPKGFNLFVTSVTDADETSVDDDEDYNDETYLGVRPSSCGVMGPCNSRKVGNKEPSANS